MRIPVIAALLVAALGASAADKPTLSICWAQWAPADALERMAKEWGEANNVTIKGNWIPWPQFADKVFNEFAAKGTTYDIVVGDSQWIGKGAKEGHYLELTDWMKTLDLSDFAPSVLAAFCEYPAASKKYWAVPCEVDGFGFCYRKDLFEDSQEKAAFKTKYGRELSVPKTWAEFKDIAEFFHRPDKKLYGSAQFTDSGQYDAITMGFETFLWAFGADFRDANWKVDGVLNSPKGVEALNFFKELCKFTPPGSTNYYHQESLRAFQTGQVAMAANYFALFPILADPAQNKLAKVTGYFACPAGPGGRFAALGGQGASIIKYVKPEQQELAKKFLAWFLKTENQIAWGSNSGSFTGNVKANAHPAVQNAAPFNAAFAETVPMLKDFYNIPEFAELLKPCQKYFNAAIAGSMSPKDALDAIAKEHEEILKKAGYLK